jgi:hypothetical protein
MRAVTHCGGAAPLTLFQIESQSLTQLPLAPTGQADTQSFAGNGVREIPISEYQQPLDYNPCDECPCAPGRRPRLPVCVERPRTCLRRRVNISIGTPIAGLIARLPFGGHQRTHSQMSSVSAPPTSRFSGVTQKPSRKRSTASNLILCRLASIMSGEECSSSCASTTAQ